MEAKQTRNSFYKLPQTVWGKLVSGARDAGEDPLLHIELMEHGQLVRVVVVPYDYWLTLPDAEASLPIEDQGRRNKTWLIHTDHSWQPHLIGLSPVGVVLGEERFLRMKEKLDAS
jgi:hypothetical protein